MQKKLAPILLTDRLILRPKQEKDVPQMLDLFRNKEVRQYLGGYPPTEERAMLRMIRNQGKTDWAVALKDSDEYIGECMLLKVVDGYLGEIGWYFRRSFWGQGYAREAAEAVIAYSRDTLGVMRLCAQIDERNERSKRLTERLGFTLEAHLPEADFGGRVADVAYYSKKIVLENRKE